MSKVLSDPILCAVDLGPLSPSLLRWSGLLASRCGCPLTVLHAQWIDLPPYFTPAQADAIASVSGGALEEARSLVNRLAAQHLPGEAVSVRVEEGDPRDVIVRTAAALHAGLIVVGARAHEAMHRFRYGSVAEDLIQSSAAPVLTLAAPAPLPSGAPILCAVDDSPASRNALVHAVRLAQCLDLSVAAVHVSAETSKDGAIADLCAWLEEQEHPACEVREITRHGNPAAQVVALASELRAGLIVVGAKHRFFGEETILGATTLRLVRHAPCPVLTVGEARPAR